jgi:hypothetical protein
VQSPGATRDAVKTKFRICAAEDTQVAARDVDPLSSADLVGQWPVPMGQIGGSPDPIRARQEYVPLAQRDLVRQSGCDDQAGSRRHQEPPSTAPSLRPPGAGVSEESRSSGFNALPRVQRPVTRFLPHRPSRDSRLTHCAIHDAPGDRSGAGRRLDRRTWGVRRDLPIPCLSV